MIQLSCFLCALELVLCEVFPVPGNCFQQIDIAIAFASVILGLVVNIVPVDSS